MLILAQQHTQLPCYLVVGNTSEMQSDMIPSVLATFLTISILHTDNRLKSDYRLVTDCSHTTLIYRVTLYI